MIQEAIRKLAVYGSKTGLVPKEDEIYTVNRLLELLNWMSLRSWMKGHWRKLKIRR